MIWREPDEEVPLVFRQRANWSIQTGAGGLSLPARQRSITPDQLIGIFTRERKRNVGATVTTKTMAEVLEEHYIDITITSPDRIGSCVCGEWTAGTMSISWDEHQADALTAAGFGLVADAWEQGKGAVWSFLGNQDPRRERPTNPYREDT